MKTMKTDGPLQHYVELQELQRFLNRIFLTFRFYIFPSIYLEGKAQY